MDYDGFLELVKNRRSIRRFKPDPIPDEYVDKIIEAARWAPSGFNTQPWEFVVVKDKKIKNDIVHLNDAYLGLRAKAEATREVWQREPVHPWRDPEMSMASAPVFIILLGDTRTQQGLPMMMRFDPAQRQSIFNSSLAMAFVYMHLAATTLGLATQWISSVATPFSHCLLNNLLSLPKTMEVYDMMVVGYPAYKPRRKLMKKTDRMVHRDHFGEDDFRTDEEVRDYIRRARAWTSANIVRGAD